VISIQAIGFRAVKASMDSRKKKLQKRKSTNAKAVIITDRWIQKNFQNEGDGVGGWDRLQPVTINSRRNSGKGAKILQDTGALKTNWKHFWNSKFARIRSGVPYAKYHDSPEPRSKLPRRQILPSEKHIIKDLMRLFGKWVGRIVRD
jgi:phage gpG-like protein